MEEIGPWALHGQEGHVCDKDAYPNSGDMEFKGPHVVMYIRSCGDPSCLRAKCACGYLSDLKDTLMAAQVAGWLHRRRVAKAPRVMAASDEE